MISIPAYLKNKKTILSIAVGILIIVSLPVALFLLNRQQDIRQRASSSTMLSIIPATSEQTIGDAFDAKIMLDTSTNQVTAVELEIIFNKDVIAIDTFTSEALSKVTENINNSSGTFRFVGATQNPVSGSNVLIGTLRIRGIKNAAATLGITKLNMAALGEGSNVIASAHSNAQITITGPLSTVSPTPTSSTVISTPTLVPTCTKTCYKDGDGDGYGSSSGETLLNQCSCISGWSINNSDCYDLNKDAKPGQTEYYYEHRGDNSWDYNCTNGNEKKYGAHSFSGDTGVCVSRPSGTVGYTSVPECGEFAPFTVCYRFPDEGCPGDYSSADEVSDIYGRTCPEHAGGTNRFVALSTGSVRQACR